MIDPMHEQQLQWIADYPHGGKRAPATVEEQYQTLHAESAAILARAAWVQIHARDVPASERIESLRGEILTDLSAAMRMLEAVGVRMQPDPHAHIPPETGLLAPEVWGKAPPPMPAGGRRCWCRRTPEDFDGNWSGRADRCPLHAEER